MILITRLRVSKENSGRHPPPCWTYGDQHPGIQVAVRVLRLCLVASAESAFFVRADWTGA